ncbi:hypothetical protein MMC22_003069 [Lobaria immixta]|nr:hypothetical protein [Lobaria immixta]
MQLDSSAASTQVDPPTTQRQLRERPVPNPASLASSQPTGQYRACKHRERGCGASRGLSPRNVSVYMLLRAEPAGTPEARLPGMQAQRTRLWCDYTSIIPVAEFVLAPRTSQIAHLQARNEPIVRRKNVRISDPNDLESN